MSLNTDPYLSQIGATGGTAAPWYQQYYNLNSYSTTFDLTYQSNVVAVAPKEKRPRAKRKVADPIDWMRHEVDRYVELGRL